MDDKFMEYPEPHPCFGDTVIKLRYEQNKKLVRILNEYATTSINPLECEFAISLSCSLRKIEKEREEAFSDIEVDMRTDQVDIPPYNAMGKEDPDVL